MNLAITMLKPTDTDFQAQIQKAIEFATKAHAGQTRKGNHLPYICHPISVLNQIADWECHDLVVWLSAICHDVDEDTKYNIDDIMQVIGHDAAMIVDELTFRPMSSDPHEKAREKKKYMSLWGEKDDHGIWVKSLRSLVVKVADRIMNTMDFITTEPAYAGKYWNKAKPLMDAMTTRREEIIAIYGETVWARMRYSQTCIVEHLY